MDDECPIKNVDEACLASSAVLTFVRNQVKLGSDTFNYDKMLALYQEAHGVLLEEWMRVHWGELLSKKEHRS